MNWKSTAATAVSGAGLLATWLGWTPARTPHELSPASVSAPAPRREQASADIAEQAARLQTRMRAEMEYRDPTRNPFRFAMPKVAARGAPPSSVPPKIEPTPPGVRESFAYTLAGMATNLVDGEVQRTAIISTPSEILFVKPGDRVGTLTVLSIDDQSVELAGAQDVVVRLTLTP